MKRTYWFWVWLILILYVLFMLRYGYSEELNVYHINPALMHYIASKEGFFKVGSLPARLHNPCALVYIKQPRAWKGPKNFAAFIDDTSGWESCENDLLHKLKHHESLNKAWEYLK